MLSQGVQCEICRSPYSYTFQKNYYCFGKQELGTVIRTQKCLFGILVAYMVACLTMLGLSVWFSEIDKQSDNFKLSNPRYLMVYVVMVLSVACIVYGVYQIITTFFVGVKVAFQPQRFVPPPQAKITSAPDPS